MKKTTKCLIVLLVVLLTVGSAFGYLIYKSKQDLEAMMALEIEPIDLSNIEDGTYEGSYRAFPVIVIVDVTVVNHIITNVEIVKHETGKGQPAEVVADTVVVVQSLEVDLITGCSYSSKAILLAIDNAINN